MMRRRLWWMHSFLQPFLPSIVENCDSEVVLRLLLCVPMWNGAISNVESKWNPVGVHTPLLCMNSAGGIEDNRVSYWNVTWVDMIISRKQVRWLQLLIFLVWDWSADRCTSTASVKLAQNGLPGIGRALKCKEDIDADLMARSGVEDAGQCVCAVQVHIGGREG